MNCEIVDLPKGQIEITEKDVIDPAAQGNLLVTD